ncbi:GNAT family N-acetyltransferase [Eubacteriales bacterium OttesenSCG-928-A19]|nr:GNAT family N-acetyltransferase [Eubacteriales bacterium OttesenSCG-928-A19]
MRFIIRPLTDTDIQALSGWRYAAPYDVYDESPDIPPNTELSRALADDTGALCGYFCWGEDAHVPVAEDVYATDIGPLDFGIALRPDITGRGLGLFACADALSWLRAAYTPTAFRLAVYEWNVRARRVYERLGFVPQTKRGDFLIMRLDESPWIDATRPLENGMPVYPFDPGFDRHLYYHKEDGGWDMSVFAMSAHTGTHIDAPAHIGRPGGTDTVPLDRLNGSVQLLDRGAGWLDAVRSPYILLHMHAGGFTPEEAQALLDAGIRMVGVDGMSVGEGETEWEVHRMLLEGGVTILENAALEGLSPGWYEMRCLPLRMPGSDGAPVRLLLRAMPS